MSTGRVRGSTTGEIALSLDARAYTLSAIQKAGYRLARSCTLVIDEVGEEETRLRLLLHKAADARTQREVMLSFYRELNDQTLRETISAETAPIRALLLAQAYSRADLVVRDDAAK